MTNLTTKFANVTLTNKEFNTLTLALSFRDEVEEHLGMFAYNYLGKLVNFLAGLEIPANAETIKFRMPDYVVISLNKLFNVLPTNPSLEFVNNTLVQKMRQLLISEFYDFDYNKSKEFMAMMDYIRKDSHR